MVNSDEFFNSHAAETSSVIAIITTIMMYNIMHDCIIIILCAILHLDFAVSYIAVVIIIEKVKYNIATQ